MTLDDLTPDSHEWPPNVVAALAKWRQGHLIKCDQWVWISQAGAKDPVTGDHAPDDETGLSPRAVTISDTGYAAIISQTCDIAAEGPGSRHPFVQACPIRDVAAAFGQDKLGQIVRGDVNDYVYLTKPPTEGACWAVDLRSSVPISKGLLAASDPIDGFRSEDDELDLGSRVASKFRRPAIHDVIANDVVGALEALISRAKGTQVWCDDVEQLRLEILEGTRLYPKRVRLVVVTDVGFSPAQKKPLRDAWKSRKKALKAEGIEQAPIAFRARSQWDIEAYRSSIPINIPALGRGRFA